MDCQGTDLFGSIQKSHVFFVFWATSPDGFLITLPALTSKTPGLQSETCSDGRPSSLENETLISFVSFTRVEGRRICSPLNNENEIK